MRVVIESPLVQLAVAGACRIAKFRRRYVRQTLAGVPQTRASAAGFGRMCEEAGYSVHRARHAITVSAGSVDVAATWRAARADDRRFHGELHHIATASHAVADARREARRDRRRVEDAAQAAEFAGLVL